MPDLEHDACARCTTVDHSQNADFPHMGEEWTADTHYFSPANVFPFSVVDNSGQPEESTAHCHSEATCEKGADNVCSVLFHCLHEKGWLREK